MRPQRGSRYLFEQGLTNTTVGNAIQLNKINIEFIRSILIICPNWVGDFVMATPTFQALRNSFPGSKITIFAKPSLLALSDGAEWCDDAFPYDHVRLYRGFFGWIRLWKQIKRQKFDLILVLPNSFRSGLVARLSGATYRIGYNRLFGWTFLTHKKNRRKEGKKFLPVYAAHYYGRLFEDFLPGQVGDELDLPLSPTQDQFAEKYWNTVSPLQNVPRITIAPGASFGSSKLWPATHFATLINRLGSEFSPKILLVPGPGEEPIADQIKSGAHYEVTILPPHQGKLGVLKSFIAQSDLVICNDSGARHIAHAFNVRAVVLMGPTDPRHSENPVAPHRVLRHPVDCAPCHLKQCPFEHHACMEGIDPEQAFKACQRYLRELSLMDGTLT